MHNVHNHYYTTYNHPLFAMYLYTDYAWLLTTHAPIIITSTHPPILLLLYLSLSFSFFAKKTNFCFETDTIFSVTSLFCIHVYIIIYNLHYIPLYHNIHHTHTHIYYYTTIQLYEFGLLVLSTNRVYLVIKSCNLFKPCTQFNL